jgi:hypothetical protein
MCGIITYKTSNKKTNLNLQTNDIFWGDHSCDCGIWVECFRDCLCLHHQTIMWWVTQLYTVLIIKVCSQSSNVLFEWTTWGNSEETGHSSCPLWMIETDNLCMQRTWFLHSQTQHPRGCHCIQFQWQLLHTEDHRCDLAMLQIDKDVCHAVWLL